MTPEEELAAAADYRRIWFELMGLLEGESRDRVYGRAAAEVIRRREHDFPPPAELRLLLAAELLPWMRTRGAVS